MKSNKHGGFDGLDESIRIHAAADDDSFAEGYEGNGHFDDDEEEEEIVTMTSDDDEEALGLQEEADELLDSDPHAEDALIAAAPPSPCCKDLGALLTSCSASSIAGSEPK